MKSRPALAWGAIALLPLSAACVVASALAGSPAPPPAAPMAKPPVAASGATSASNPDNMPMKKTKGPATDDQMMRSDPASAAKAK
ncbi:hypothetical protein SAMN05421548_13558 [Paraburkholderia lycopersici]|uniref:Lipoprotein n=1 Tax=Paraburkholderia lycopersici TaxID=416944 RepID=A0A1G7AT94_9BURK|nr:hypothetical protein [Paraburkholderia lycopersici]SDE17757.1 hypothetical protein SAMN05421548_13558 [Paraburkholderia lycopersici]